MNLNKLSREDVAAIDLGDGGFCIFDLEHGWRYPRDFDLPSYEGLVLNESGSVKGGATRQIVFHRLLLALKAENKIIVTENTTPGTSGIEPERLAKFLEENQITLYKISNRMVLNYKRDNPGEQKRIDEQIKELAKQKKTAKEKLGLTSREHLPKKIKQQFSRNIDDEAADRIIFDMSIQRNCIAKWEYTPKENKLIRDKKSLRPDDTRQESEPEAQQKLKRLPNYLTLPKEMQKWCGNGKKYDFTVGIAFSDLMEESALVKNNTLKTFMKLIGNYAFGHPCFYRERLVNGLMVKLAKQEEMLNYDIVKRDGLWYIVDEEDHDVNYVNYSTKKGAEAALKIMNEEFRVGKVHVTKGNIPYDIRKRALIKNTRMLKDFYKLIKDKIG